MFFAHFRGRARNRVCRTALLTITLSALAACGVESTSNDARTPTTPVAPQNVMLDDDAPLRWSDPASWGGSVPGAGANVVVPAGRTFILDTNVNVGSLTINGRLVCAASDLSLSARWIMVHGELQCGTDRNPYVHRLLITLKGQNKAESVMGMGTKVLAAMNGGLISLHGEERTSWLMLDATANRGDTSIQVESQTNWRKGDSIVIASTADDMHQAEVRQITRINGKTIYLDSPLQHRHFGEMQSFSNANRTWTVDTRAEVGLLTRNIRIQGDAQSTQSGFGGHIMIMQGSVGLIAGVELYRMGQTGILARYPFHWHLTGNVAGQYIRNSSIRKSFSRCVTVHGAHNALVEDNVCYDHLGHGYFLEDGVETGNVFKRNLGLLTRRPTPAQALLVSDFQQGEASRGPSTFWISNGDNTFEGNAAAGSDGLGFWYDTKKKPTGASAGLSQYQNVSPETSEFGSFVNNRVHSSDMAFSSCTEVSGPVGYSPPNVAEYINLTVFASGEGAVWPCHGNQIFSELKITDTGFAKRAGFVAPRPVTVRNSLFVANSKLSEGNRGRRRSAIGIYDFGVRLRNVHFENYDYEYGGSHVFGARAADVRFTSNPARGLTFTNSPLLYDRRNEALDMRPSQWGALIHDEDGSFGLGSNTALVADHPMMTDSTCTDTYGTGRLCANRYGRVKLDFGLSNLPDMTHVRSDGVAIVTRPHEARAHYQSIVAVNQTRYHYGYSFNPIVYANRQLSVDLQYLHNNDTVVLDFNNLPANARVITPGYTAASSINDLKTGDGKRFIRAGARLLIKMQATGSKWNAADSVVIGW